MWRKLKMNLGNGRNELKRGEIIYANFEPIKGSEQGGIRPALVLQNDYGNNISPVTIVAGITSNVLKKDYPTNIFISKGEGGLKLDSTILLNQIRTIDKIRITKKLGSISPEVMNKVEKALLISLGMEKYL